MTGAVPGLWPWLLSWILPALSVLLTAVLIVRALEAQNSGPLVDGEVIRVEEQRYRASENDGSVVLYRPYFKYRLEDGTVLEGRPDQASPKWNFPVGTTVEIRHDPSRRGVVMMPGASKWTPAFVMALIALVVTGIAWWFGHLGRRRTVEGPR